MKPIFMIFPMIICYNALLGQNQDEKRFAFKDNFVISLFGGGAEIIGDPRKNVFPVINPAFGYHLTDRFCLVAESISYLSGSTKPESNMPDFQFKQAAHHGLAIRYYTKKNLKCGTPTFQTGAYFFDTGVDKPTLNWIFTPGWLYPLNKKEKFFIEMAGDFQMNRIIKGESFLMTAKLGLSCHF